LRAALCPPDVRLKRGRKVGDTDTFENQWAEFAIERKLVALGPERSDRFRDRVGANVVGGSNPESTFSAKQRDKTSHKDLACIRVVLERPAQNGANSLGLADGRTIEVRICLSQP